MTKTAALNKLASAAGEYLKAENTYRNVVNFINKRAQQAMPQGQPAPMPPQQAQPMPQGQPAPQQQAQAQGPDPLLAQMMQMFSQLPPGAFQQLISMPDEQLVMATQQGQIPGELTQMIMMLRHGSEQQQAQPQQ